MKTEKKLICSGVFAALTAVLIFLLKNIDRRQVGPWDKSIGLARTNLAVFRMFGSDFDRGWYNITSYIGVFALAVAMVFAMIGLYQLIRRKSILNVDSEILALGFIYVLTVVIYIVFDRFVVNYRPLIIPGTPGPEPSFPSSHTLLTVVILVSAFMVMSKYVTNVPARMAAQAGCIVLVLIMMVGRVAAGVHWFTDILGAVLISSALLFMFSAVQDMLEE